MISYDLEILKPGSKGASRLLSGSGLVQVFFLSDRGSGMGPIFDRSEQERRGKKKEHQMVTAETTKKNQEYLKLAEKHVNQVVPFCWPLVAEKGEGSHLYDVDGNAYLDFTSGIAVNNLGHCHPKIVEAVKKQAGVLMHTSCVTMHPLYVELSKRLAELSPGRLDTVFLANTGAEVVEGSLKMARYVTGRPAIISFKGAFHGRTLLATALTTSKLYYREKYEPLPSSLFTVPYPYVFRSNSPDNPEACVDVQALRASGAGSSNYCRACARGRRLYRSAQIFLEESKRDCRQTQHNADC
jgi:4-aminobutyrate aminotransferase-like enzyme